MLLSGHLLAFGLGGRSRNESDGPCTHGPSTKANNATYFDNFSVSGT